MSAIFIIKYAGAPLRFAPRFQETVREDEATQFTSVGDAWREIYEQGLAAKHCEVVPLKTETIHPS
jgi:hypothetical protein